MAASTLQYFDIRGPAETTRLVFAFAGQKYTDERFHSRFIEMREGLRTDWDEKKDEIAPFGKMPNLVLSSGESIPQSHAINRYLAKQFGLMGSNDVQAAWIDAVGEQVIDQRKAFLAEAGKGAEQRLKFIQEDLPKWYGYVEAFAKAHGGSSGIIGNKISLGDIQFYYNHTRFNDTAEDTQAADQVLKSMPLLSNIMTEIENDQGIKTWLETRHKSKF